MFCYNQLVFYFVVQLAMTALTIELSQLVALQLVIYSSCDCGFLTRKTCSNNELVQMIQQRQTRQV